MGRAGFPAALALVLSCHAAREDRAPVGTTSLSIAVQSPGIETPAPGPKHCPQGMVLVEGEYCPNVVHTCLEWMDPPGPYRTFRCKRYKQPAVCQGARVHKRFCIDEKERTEEGSDLPLNKKSFTDASNICKASGARLCLTSEWNFACEGEEMRPYPYGFERDSEACNSDIAHDLGKVGRLVDHRTPASAHPRCVSPFGVHDMSGNVDEWTILDGAPPGARELMKGSWWMPGRNHCRGGQGGHGARYAGTETGVRCCKDAD
jgi:formylglycine-generating enzyme required for sulfatase activity